MVSGRVKCLAVALLCALSWYPTFRWPQTQTAVTPDTAVEEEATASPETDNGSLSTCGAFNATKFRNAVAKEGRRYIVAEEMRHGYGFTNQMIVYASLAAWAETDSRIIVFPNAKTHFLKLVSLNTSAFDPPIKYVSSQCEADAVEQLPGQMRMKNPRFNKLRQTLSRFYISVHPCRSLKLMHVIMFHTRNASVLRAWDFYERWPFACTTGMSFSKFMCAIRFNDAFERHASRIEACIARDAADHAKRKRSLLLTGRGDSGNETLLTGRGDSGNETHVGGYLAVHLRMEPQDMISMGRSYSTPTQVAEFFNRSIFELARAQGLSTILLCSGKLHPEVEETLRALGNKEGFQIVRKSDYNISITAEATHVYETRGRTSYTTNTHASIYDLLLLERASVVVLTAYSSFTQSVYARRCCMHSNSNTTTTSSSSNSNSTSAARGQNNGVYLYEVYLDGTLTLLRFFPCGFAMGRVMKTLLLPDPPPELSFFKPLFDTKNPLFTEPSRNQGDIRYPPNASLYHPNKGPRMTLT